VIELLEPVRRRYEELSADPGELRRLLAIGAEKARTASAPTLERMYELMGFVPGAATQSGYSPAKPGPART
jgi:tryptophanyl-tRNA synthetase